MSVPIVSNKSYECGMCEVTAALMERVVFRNDTHTDIDMEVCSMFPSSLQPSCLHVFNVYYKELVEYIYGGFTPEHACNRLNLCVPKRNVVMQFPRHRMR